jgi:hypothetical protein
MRTEEFADGAVQAREPQFSTVQQQGIQNYKQLSTLETPTMRVQNGLGDRDLERRLTGVSESVGISEGTRERRMWMPKNIEPSSRYQYSQSQDA